MKKSKLSVVISFLLASGVSSNVTFAAENESVDNTSDMERIQVTGSRIKKTELETSTPTSTIDSEQFELRGYVNVADALLETPFVSGSDTPQTSYNGSSIGSGQYFINLFNLGSQRTLTLVNGRRFVSSNSAGNGAGGNQVDASLIPTGLIDRIETIQVGGAAVYGSDAISGVVNYILKNDFDGVEFDAQYGRTTKGDYPVKNFRATLGENFLNGNANLALNIEYSDTGALKASDREVTNRGYAVASNPLDTGPNDGISSVAPILDRRFSEFNDNGVLFSIPAPLPMFFVSNNGTPLQFDQSGELVAYNPGTYFQPSFAEGGEGYRYADISSLYASVERVNANLIGHINFANDIILSGEALYSKSDNVDPLGAQIYNATLLSGADGPLAFDLSNPYLSDSAKATLQSASYFLPGAGVLPYVGQPIYLSKSWNDLLHSREIKNTNETYRLNLNLEGYFEAFNNSYDWAITATYGKSIGTQRQWGVNQEKFLFAYDSTLNANGDIVCADTTQSGCAPINPFGLGNVSDEARTYVNEVFEQEYVNEQQNLLALMSGPLVELPAGEVMFSVGYEYRKDTAEFNPNNASKLGVGRDQAIKQIKGSYHTNELSFELDVPVFDNDFGFFNINTAYRYVDNSLTGDNKAWNVGLSYRPFDNLMLRATKGFSFRTPSLTELYLPQSTASITAGLDPCDQRNIDSGPVPATRRTNCEMMFQTLGIDGSNFTSNAQNFSIDGTRQGNEELKNEEANSYSLGVVYEPEFIEGLSLTLDHINIEITNSIEDFSLENALQVCYDSTVQSSSICSLFTRSNDAQIVDAQNTYINAGVLKFVGQNIDISYSTPFQALSSIGLNGTLAFSLNATHVEKLEKSVTEFDLARLANTVSQPEWKAVFNVNYSQDNAKFTYYITYMDDVYASEGATIENSVRPVISENFIHNASLNLSHTDNLSTRFGVKNLFDEEPSYPTVSYGDVIGRQLYAGVTYKF